VQATTIQFCQTARTIQKSTGVAMFQQNFIDKTAGVLLLVVGNLLIPGLEKWFGASSYKDPFLIYSCICLFIYLGGTGV
jgi:hypothetical protein